MEKKAGKRTVLLVTTSASFLTPFMGSSVNLALPSIGKELAMDAILLTWISTSYLLAAAIFLVPMGRVADLYGRKRIFSYGIILFTLSSFLLGITNSSALFIALRILQGGGGAMIFGTGTAILTSVFPPGEKGKALGINVTAVYLGLSLGPFIGGFLTEHLGWRSIFWAVIPLGILVLSAIRWKMKGEWAGVTGENFDFMGSLLYGLALFSIIYGFSHLPRAAGVGFLLVGASTAVGFLLWEIRVPNPVLDIRLFRHNRAFLLSNLAALVHYCATFGVGFLLSLYLQYLKLLSPWHAGLVLVAQPAMQALISPFAGRLSDKVEPRFLASAGMAFTALGLFCLAFLHPETGLGWIIFFLLFLGFGFGLFSSPNTNAVMSSIEGNSYGVASGIVGTMRLLGQMFSMGIVTLIFTLFLGNIHITPASLAVFLRGTHLAFLIFAFLCLLGFFASLARGKIHRFPKHDPSGPSKTGA